MRSRLVTSITLIHWCVQLSFVLGFSAHEVLSAIFSLPHPLPLLRLCCCCCRFFVFVFPPLVFSSVTGACSFPFVWGLMAGLRCYASHGGIISILGLAANSGSPWILQAPNLHFSDAAVKTHCNYLNFRKK